jgi:hypothetical protein
VLDLEAGVDLEEPEPAVAIEEELDGCGVDEPGDRRRPGGGGVQRAPLIGGEAGRRRLLDELLMAPLERTVALAERHDPAVGITDQLNLDMAGRPNLALDVDRAVAEHRAGLGGSGGQRGGQVIRCQHPSHPTAAASRRGLDEQRKPDALGLGDDRSSVVRPVDRRRLEGTRDDRHARRRRAPSAGELVAERRDRRARRPDERETGVLDRAGKLGPLGKEPVAGMDRLGTGSRGGVEDRVDAQVALGRGRRPEPNRLVGGADVLRGRVCIAEDGNRFDPELVARPDDPDGNLAAVRDKDAPERRPPPSCVFAQRRRGGRGHSGMFPCFFGGLVSRLSARSSRAAISRGRVSDGRMTSSTYPRAAAMYGFANRSS